MEQKAEVNKILNHLFRQESGKMVSVLTRLFGLAKLDIAQDLVQDTLLAAMAVWPYRGIPENPSAWLMQVAKNKAIDFLRSKKKAEFHSSEYQVLLESEYTLGHTVQQMFTEGEIEDNQLRMMFACCHPALPTESQIALVLKLLCGFGVKEIASAYLTNADTITKRIYRAKEKLRAENVRLQMPEGQQLISRLSTIQKVLYLMFNEGYYSANPNYIIREDICEDAMRLCYLLIQNSATNTAETKALLALMCLQSARFNARTNAAGHIIQLQFQNRQLWHRGLIEQGYQYLEQASRQAFEQNNHTHFSVYHIEAAISSLHCHANSFSETNWHKIHELYDALYQLNPSSIVLMNKAVALAYSGQPQMALDQLQNLQNLENNHIYHSIIGEISKLSGNANNAQIHFEKAFKYANTEAELHLISEKMKG
jgi:RNA polymerase sigma factor (sigma-70 family)